MAGGAGGEARRTSLVAASSEDGDGGANIPSAVAMAGEHWNVGFDEVVSVAAAAVGDVIADDMLRIRGFNIIGVPGSDMGDDDDDSSMLSRPGR